jgi:hypothetical protein
MASRSKEARTVRARGWIDEEGIGKMGAVGVI